MAKSVIVAPENPELREHAEAIRALGKRVVGDIIEIGRRLIAAKALAGHGGWLPWLDREFGWKERAAQNFIAVAEAAGKSAKFADLNVPVSALYLMAAPSTPSAVIEAVAERTAQRNRTSLPEVRTMIAAARPPLAAVKGFVLSSADAKRPTVRPAANTLEASDRVLTSADLEPAGREQAVRFLVDALAHFGALSADDDLLRADLRAHLDDRPALSARSAQRAIDIVFSLRQKLHLVH